MVCASWFPDIPKAAIDVEGAADDSACRTAGNEIDDDASAPNALLVLSALLLGATRSVTTPVPIFGFEVKSSCCARVASGWRRVSPWNRSMLRICF